MAATSHVPDRTVVQRVGAVAVALFWVLPFFGLIDFMQSVITDVSPDLLTFVVLSTSWGLLYLCLLPVPLIAWSVQPFGWVGPQVLAIGAAVLVAGVAAAAWGQVFVALLITASAGFPGMWRPTPRWSLRLLLRGALWPVDVLVLVGLVAAVVEMGDLIDMARRGAPDDNTNGLMHLPMQAGFALAVPAAAAVAVLALANGVSGWWFAIVPPASSAVWFGLVSTRFPERLGSLGELAGRSAVGWGVVTAVAVWATGFWVRRTGRAKPRRVDSDG
ncbi:MAG: hypothetical protein ABWX84_06905 [Nocardioides sp.]